MTNIENQELRKSLREKKEENEKLQSGTSTSTICTVYSNMFIVTSTSTICTVYSNMFIHVGTSTSTIYIVYSNMFIDTSTGTICTVV